MSRVLEISTFSLMLSLNQRDNFTYFFFKRAVLQKTHNIRFLQLNVGIINRVYLRSQASSAT